jgi:Tol biopolymer transport system component
MKIAAAPIRALVAFITLISGCANSTEPGGSAATMRLVAGNGATDTVRATLAQALVAEVRDEHGQPAPGVQVRFEAAKHALPGGALVTETSVERVDFLYPGDFAVDTTDARGQALVVVQLGKTSGPARVTISVPLYGIADTAMFTVRPGNAARITFSVPDTAATTSVTYSLGATVRDVFGNPRAGDVPLYNSVSSVAGVTSAGTVTTSNIGRGAIVASIGERRDTAWVSVVPSATIAVLAQLDGGLKVATVGLDGSNYTPLTSVSSNVVLPHWNTAGDHLAFFEGSGFDARVSTVDIRGVRSPLVVGGGGSASQYYPRYSVDGQWIFFTASGSPSDVSAIWRARTDGSAAERITALDGVKYSEAAPSPDGTRLVLNANGAIATLELATGAVRSLGVLGDFPEFSPDGSRIVYITSPSHQLGIVDADGTNPRILNGHSYHLFSSPGWSPDGKWIVLGKEFGRGAFDLIDAATFDVIPLTTLHSMFQPSFKP